MGTSVGRLGSVVTTRSSSEGGRRLSIREVAGVVQLALEREERVIPGLQKLEEAEHTCLVEPVGEINSAPAGL